MIGGFVRLLTSYTTPSQRTTLPPHHPPIMYGTAWKKERTAELVLLALRAGFRGIDTACQPKHYNESAVGDALVESGVPRAEVYLQTKYTPLAGQDPQQLPYDASAPLEEQVSQSVRASLRNLRTSWIDCLVLHSPLPTHAETLRVWRSMEAFVASGEVRALGISNQYSVRELQRLHADADVKPSCVQNRFYAETRHDVDVRRWCAKEGVVYQSFWTLTGNKHILQGRAVKAVARAHGVSPEQTWLGFVRALGCVPLSGTTSAEHMAHDLHLPELSEQEVSRLSALID